MSIERKEDGSVTIRYNTGMTVVSKVTRLTDDKWEEKFQKAMKDYAKLVTACAHTIVETE